VDSSSVKVTSVSPVYGTPYDDGTRRRILGGESLYGVAAPAPAAKIRQLAMVTPIIGYTFTYEINAAAVNKAFNPTSATNSSSLTAASLASIATTLAAKVDAAKAAIMTEVAQDTSVKAELALSDTNTLSAGAVGAQFSVAGSPSSTPSAQPIAVLAAQPAWVVPIAVTAGVVIFLGIAAFLICRARLLARRAPAGAKPELEDALCFYRAQADAAGPSGITLRTTEDAAGSGVDLTEAATASSPREVAPSIDAEAGNIYSGDFAGRKKTDARPVESAK
jgi:hypothetical protein